MLEFGTKCRDKISGFEGIVTSRTQHMEGPTTHTLTGELTEGRIPAYSGFTEKQLEILSEPSDELKELTGEDELIRSKSEEKAAAPTA